MLPTEIGSASKQRIGGTGLLQAQGPSMSVISECRHSSWWQTRNALQTERDELNTSTGAGTANVVRSIEFADRKLRFNSGARRRSGKR